MLQQNENIKLGTHESECKDKRMTEVQYKLEVVLTCHDQFVPDGTPLLMECLYVDYDKESKLEFALHLALQVSTNLTEPYNIIFSTYRTFEYSKLNPKQCGVALTYIGHFDPDGTEFSFASLLMEPLYVDKAVKYRVPHEYGQVVEMPNYDYHLVSGGADSAYDQEVDSAYEVLFLAVSLLMPSNASMAGAVMKE